MDPEIAAAFADTRRHFDVVGEQMRGDMRLLAEAFSTRIDRLEENLREELLRSQRELSAMIKLSYAVVPAPTSTDVARAGSRLCCHAIS